MQQKISAILKKINKQDKKLNILNCSTHESFQHSFGKLPHTFYLYQADGLVNWCEAHRPIPRNHILLDKSVEQIKPCMNLDICLIQQKFGQYQKLMPIAKYLGLPTIVLEHTTIQPDWNKKYVRQFTEMRGSINAFITEYNVGQWGFSLEDRTVKVIQHGIDNHKFCSNDQAKPDGKICTVVNDYENRDIFCGWSIYKKLVENLPINPWGDTPGFSKKCDNVEHLIKQLQGCSVFLNTSIVSPLPMSILEAASVSCPIVTTATCEIPKFFKDGENCFCSNNLVYLRDRLEWCLKNPEEARNTIGKAAREMICRDFSLEKHLQSWENVFQDAYSLI